MRTGARIGVLALAVLLLVLGPGARPGEAIDAGPGAGPSPPLEAATAVAMLKKMVADGQYARAETAAREFVASETAAGRFETEAVCMSLRYLIEALYRQDKSKDPETLALAEQALELARRLFGEDDERYAAALSGVANVHFRREEYDLARSFWTQSKAVRERVFGPESRQVALDCNNLASVEGITGNFTGARVLMERALAIQQKVLGPDSPELAHVHTNFAIFLDHTGDLLGAASEAALAVQIREKALPADHPLTASSLHVLATIRSELGDYVAARALYERVIAIQEKSSTAEDFDTALARSELAMVLASTGRFDEAMALHEKALATLVKNLGPNHTSVAEARSDMGNLLARLGRPADAKRLFQLALASQEATFGPVHQDVAVTLNRLGAVEWDSGDASSARQHYERALQVLEKVYSPTHHLVAVSLEGLGELQLAAGDLDAAERSLRRALSIREEALGPEHPQVAETLVGLARVEWGRGRAREALSSALRSEEILRKHFGQVIRGLSESEALSYEKVRASGLDVALSVLASGKTGDRTSGAVREVWDAITRSRALVLDLVAVRHQMLALYGTPELRQLVRERAAATQRLASLVVKGPDRDHPQGYRDAVSRAAQEKEHIERELAARTGEADESDRSVAEDRLRAALPDGTALLAYAQYRRVGAGIQRSGEPAHSRSSAAYAALLLRKDAGAPRFVDLGDARDIDARVERWERQMAPPTAALDVRSSSRDEEYRETGSALRRKVWDPVEPYLKGAKHVFVVPDGALSLLSFSVLPLEEGGYLVESGPLLHYLSTERDLLRPAPGVTHGRGALLMGAPDFDVLPQDVGVGAVTVQAKKPASGDEAASVFRGPTAECEGFRSLHFEPLPGALREVAEIDVAHFEPGTAPVAEREAASRTGGPEEGESSHLLRLTGLQANEAAFKRLAPDRRLLHLASHAFLLDDRCGADATDGSPAAARPEARVLGENPLLLSGIALAGANQRARAGADDEDGILTAEEIAALDLSGVEWVVLSGCKTAVGVVQAGEGILGLRRAFEVAGVRTLIMSLWSVDDRSTLEWMKSLYLSRAQGQPTAEAVRAASLAVLESRRARGKSTHPFYWGAFVAAGDWR